MKWMVAVFLTACPACSLLNEPIVTQVVDQGSACNPVSSDTAAAGCSLEQTCRLSGDPQTTECVASDGSLGWDTPCAANEGIYDCLQGWACVPTNVMTGAADPRLCRLVCKIGAQNGCPNDRSYACVVPDSASAIYGYCCPAMGC